MKKLLFIVMMLYAASLSYGQRIARADRKILQQKEDSLKTYAKDILMGRNLEDRVKADSIFTRIFMRALKTPQSFYYHFDSLETISQLYAPDSSFKIYTWQMMVNENVIRQHGTIQMRTPDGSLVRFPLIDRSETTTNAADTVGDNFGWIGAVYYRIILKKDDAGNKYYTLLGYDEGNIRSNRKMIEVLRFQNDKPVFGGRYFVVEDELGSKKYPSRYIMEFKKEAGPRLMYDEEQDMIIVEHLVSESNQPTKTWTLIGDGDYEGYKWANGKWVNVKKVYNYITPMGKEPVPKPLRDNEGNMNQGQLKGNEDDDTPAVQPKTTPKPVKPVKKNGDE